MHFSFSRFSMIFQAVGNPGHKTLILKYCVTCFLSSLTSSVSLWWVFMAHAFPLANSDALSIRSGRSVPEKMINGNSILPLFV